MTPAIAETAVQAPQVEERADEFRAAVLRGLAAPQKWLPCKYFYDAAGSELFERICELPEYYPTRCELAILRAHAREMVDVLGDSCMLIEYGSGSGRKTRLLLDQLAPPLAYVPVDIARQQLRESAVALSQEYPHVQVLPMCADFTRPLSPPALDGRVRRRVVFFPGSTIGNLTRDETLRLLRQTARLCGPDGGLLLGADLKKDPRIIEAAYNDRQGVTAAFNLNLLVRMNRELAGDFNPAAFWHHAFYNPGPGRIEMHLVSRQDQRVRVAGREFEFRAGESICTEHSHKYTHRDLRKLAECSGFEVARIWTDPREQFTVQYLKVARPLTAHRQAR